MVDAINLGKCSIGAGRQPFIIAEMSGNHNQSLDRALAIVQAAAESGAHAIKLQTYTADTLTLDVENDEFLINDAGSPWRGQSLYNLYRQAYTPWEWHEPIFKRCRELGLTVFSTPFDETAVDFLEGLGTPAYKIASFENNHLPLIRRAAKTGKPLLISTGLATIGEIEEAVKTAREAGCNDLILLKCTSSYPATAKDANILTIPHMRKSFDCEVGLSDHTIGIGVAVASVALGATVIEKHFTLSRADGGVDSVFSMEPSEMKALVAETYAAWQALGRVSYDISETEKTSLRFRRSLYVVQDIKKGEPLTMKNLKVIRPGMGLQPKYFESMLGKRVKFDVKRGTPLSWEIIDDNNE